MTKSRSETRAALRRKIEQQARRTSDQYLAASRCDDRHIAVHGDESERSQRLDCESIHARGPRCGAAQILQRFPLIVRQIVVEFVIHSVHGLLNFLERVIAAAHEIRATTT